MEAATEHMISPAGDPFAAYPEYEDFPCLSCLDTGYVTIGYEEDDEEFYEEVPCRRCNKIQEDSKRVASNTK